MPTYEYLCDACGREFEAVKRMSDPVEAACPHCGADRTHRLISHSSFVLKGSGWYLTDYARKNSSAGLDAKGASSAPAPAAKPAEPAPAPAAKHP
jgi:putative FmdB family regulatory protein